MESRLNSRREMRSKENAGEDRKGERERERRIAKEGAACSEQKKRKDTKEGGSVSR